MVIICVLSEIERGGGKGGGKKISFKKKCTIIYVERLFSLDVLYRKIRIKGCKLFHWILVKA